MRILSPLLLLLPLLLLAAYRCLIWMPVQQLATARGAVDAGTEQLAQRLRGHVVQLAERIGERNHLHPGALDQAASYLQDQLAALGYTPYQERFTGRGASGETQRFRNVWAQKPGSADTPGLIVVGAHYDSVAGTPGADDNASGVAALLELARLLRDQPLRHPLRFVAFTNEEPPFSHTELMGSRVHARALRAEGVPVRAMLSLESLGVYRQEPGTQSYPPLIHHFYPDRGNFVAFIANLDNRALVHEVITAFRRAGRFPSEGMTAPELLVPDISRSDHASFWHQGFPALMVTDTADFRTPFYHTAEDRLRHLDLTSLALVVQGLNAALTKLANR